MKNKYNSSVLELKELEATINMLLKSYKDAQLSYNQSISISDINNAKRWIGIMDNIITNIGKILDKSGQIVQQLETKGIEYQQIASIDSIYINNLSKTLEDKSQEVAKLQAHIINIDGDMKSSVLEQTSNYTHMIILFFVGIVIVLFISKSVLSNETSFAENIILVIAVASLLYYIFNSFT